MQQLTILGSTGSIGKSTLEVVRTNRDQFAILALTADNNVAEMLRQCLTFQPPYAAMLSPAAAQQLQRRLGEHGSATEVLTGVEAICHLAALPQANQVVAAIAGTAGLLPTLAAVRAGKRLLLANKESLVTCGAIFMAAVERSGAQLLPIDSEHNAIFQCLPPEIQQRAGWAVLEQHGIQRIILTASGGPFHRTALTDLQNISPEQACAHPNWSMGRKISVDSATMMNKGLEYIEARWLFNASAKQLEVVVHPQSVIHSMVQFTDGGLLAQCSPPDMRIPISYALAYPRRIPSGAPMLDFNFMSQLTFEAVDCRRYPCLPLAIMACASGQAATTVLNAANEVAVAAFLQRRLSFTAISHINEETLTQLQPPEPNSVDAVLWIDRQARQVAQRLIDHRGSVCS